jgi:ABC-2 type transport system ATP-binding protein
MVTSTASGETATQRAQCVVQLEGVKKKFRNGNEALRGLDLEVQEGDIFGIIGPDGAGKTTALQIIAGVLEPSQGRIRVFGLSPRNPRAEIGYLPQVTALYPELTVEENLKYEAGLRNVSGVEFQRRRDELLASMGLDRFKDRLSAKLSGGMKQKLELACALISRPRLLLLDEPTTGVDPISRQELWRILSSSVKDGVTLLLATPSLEEAEFCNRVALMYDGKVHESGSPEELADKLGLSRVEALYDSAKQARAAAQRIEDNKIENINDVFLFGDRVQILVDGKRNSAQSTQKLLEEDEELRPQWSQVTKANLENVFVLKLRELGLADNAPTPLPRLRKDSQAAANSDSSDTTRGIAIQAKGLSKSFADFQAVKNIDLEVKYGEIFGLLGANGAGKTTTIKMLCGIVEPGAGEVIMAGQNSKLRSKQVRRRLGYMSQKFSLYDELTVLENLEFYASIFDVPRSKRQEKIDWALSACGLKGKEKALVKSLPRGWKQRIAFGASVMHEPTILFLDEPTAGVDPIARRQLWTMIRDMADHGAAVLVSTHFLEEASNCDRLVFMSNGEFVAQGTPEEIKSSQPGKLIEIDVDDIESSWQSLDDLDPWRISVYAGKLHVILDNPDTDLPSIEEKLKNAHVKISSSRPVPFRLDDVFISLIQRSRGEANDQTARTS